MIKVPRSQSSIAQNLIYPETRKTDNTFHKKNINALKKMQANNRIKKDEEENSVPVEPYKLKEFKNVESRLTKMLKTNETISYKNNDANRDLKKNTKTNMEKSKSSGMLKTKTNSKMTKKPTLQKPIAQNYNTNNNNLIIKTYDPITNKETNVVEENIYNFNSLEKDYNQLRNKSPKNNYINQEKENINNANKKQNLKGPTPKSNEINVLATKQHKDYIAENKNKITQNLIPSKVVQKEEPEAAIHKNYGKTPEYLLKYQKEAEEKKELQKRLAEQAKYPKGTRLLSEDERLETLHNLNESRKEIITTIEKMPISMRTASLQNRKAELERKLTEIEDAIHTFSRKQVFVKVDI